MKTTLAVLTDLHYGNTPPGRRCRGDIADILCRRAVHRLNRVIRPDVTVVPGDLLDNGSAPDAEERRTRLKTILDGLNSRGLILPGNHDGDTDAFYRVFTRPSDIEEICGIRFLTFLDPDEPGYNARRRASDLGRFRAARDGFKGPIVSLQHVCLAPADRTDIPYGYTNAAAIVAAMTQSSVALSLSGHYHNGAPPVRHGNITFVNAPALCEGSFPFLVVTLENGRVSVEKQTLAMPPELHLIDRHVHTELAYCSENVTVERALALAPDFGLAGLGFAEHSGQLYFDKTRYWSGECLRDGISTAREEDNRMPAYLAILNRLPPGAASRGLEVDCDYQGGLLLKPADRKNFDYLIGALHGLPSLRTPGIPLKTLEHEFLALLTAFLQNSIDILAHPFRLFRKAGLIPPERLFKPVAELLRKQRTAAEINFHTNEPSVEFVRHCLEQGVKLSFGSDTHNLYELGEFAAHLQLLKEAGCQGNPADVLYRPETDHDRR